MERSSGGLDLYEFKQKLQYSIDRKGCSGINISTSMIPTGSELSLKYIREEEGDLSIIN